MPFCGRVMLTSLDLHEQPAFICSIKVCRAPSFEPGTALAIDLNLHLPAPKPMLISQMPNCPEGQMREATRGRNQQALTADDMRGEQYRIRGQPSPLPKTGLQGWKARESEGIQHWPWQGSVEAATTKARGAHGFKAATSDLLYPSLHQGHEAHWVPVLLPFPRLMGQSSFAQTWAAQSTPLELDKINLQKTARCN